MKALSVKQPFAGWIAEGEKTVEIRSRPIIKYLKEPILICSSWSKVDDEAIRSFHPITTTGNFKCGIALCVVEFFLCGTQLFPDSHMALEAELDYTYLRNLYKKKRHYAWYIDTWNVQKVKPFPVKGRLGFFDVDDDLIEVIK